MTEKKFDFKRIMLKISGEALGGDDGIGIDQDTLAWVSKEIASVVSAGKQVAVVMGAGNFFRGLKGVAGGMDRVAADQMGMIATLMNAIALRDGLEREGVGSVVLSAIPVGTVADPYSPRIGRKLLEKGRVVLCAAGTGNPFFTTDTAAALRACELGCDVMFKSTKVDGVYDMDPVNNPEARRFETLSYDVVLEKQLGVMDLTAITLAAENVLPVIVFKMEKGVLKKIALGDITPGTYISGP